MAKKQAAAAPAIPADLLTLIAERETILPWLEQAKARELELRAQITAQLFPAPVEGANRLFTADGYEVYLDHKINRSIDEAAIDAVMAELPEGCPAREIGVLIKYKPSLVLDGYRALPADQLAIVQQAITEKPGTGTLVIKRFTSTEEAEAAGATPIMDAYQAAKVTQARPNGGAPATAANVPASTTGPVAVGNFVPPTARNAKHKNAANARLKSAAGKAHTAKRMKGKR